MKKTKIDVVLDGLFRELNKKQKTVIAGRYGLAGKERTLQEIGDDFGVTRERIRQVESQGLKKLKKIIVEECADIFDLGARHLEEAGGVKADAEFVRELKAEAGFPDAKGVDNKIRFLFFALGKPFYFRENPFFRPFWHKDSPARERFFSFIKNTEALFNQTKKEKGSRGVSDLVEALKARPDFHFLFISKKFGVGPFGDTGPLEWSEVNPKNIKDKAYLALKMIEKPLHFSDIASHIHKLGISKKPVNIQTVHNELIKDGRFVLIGRGVYALNEHGYEPGTVKDVIADIIGEKGPLLPGQVVDLVNERRILRRNTILLGLQDKKCFERMEDGKYKVRKA